MEDQVSWKGHSFTLIIFIGIVILCSIFFVLGMVVGRGQTSHAAETSTTPAAKIEKTASPSASDKDTPIIVDRSPVTPTPKIDEAPPKPVAKAKVPEPSPAPVAASP